MARTSVALLVGVSKVKGLPFLPGVADGVSKMAAWASSQGFVTVTLDDATGAVIAVGDIYEQVAAAVEDGVQRLFLYFAGHGAVRGGDLWILTDGDRNPNEAVNVQLSVELARDCGIPHVAFFADACRTPVGKTHLRLAGESVFPMNTGTVGHTTFVDEFYATRAGDAAIEVIPDGRVERAFGIFTDCLLDGLHGEDERAVQEVEGGVEPWAVVASSLRRYLREEVPLAVEQAADLIQHPDLRPSSEWRPDVLAWIPGRPSGQRGRRRIIGAIDAIGTSDAAGEEGDVSTAAGTGNAIATFASAWGVQASDLEDAASGGRPVTDALGPVLASHLEALGGAPAAGGGPYAAVVHGAAVLELRGRDVELSSPLDDAAVLVAYDPGAALCRVATPLGDRWVAVPLLPGHDSVVDAGRPTTIVQFRPTAADAEPNLVSDVARAAALDAMGRTGTVPLVEASANPTLVLAAAAEASRSGRRREVAQLAHASLDRHGWIVFDVALLAGMNLRDVPVFPRFPVRSATWALLEAPGAAGFDRDVLLAARPFLVATSATTFDDELPDDLIDELANSRDLEVYA